MPPSNMRLSTVRICHATGWIELTPSHTRDLSLDPERRDAGAVPAAFDCCPFTTFIPSNRCDSRDSAILPCPMRRSPSVDRANVLAALTCSRFAHPQIAANAIRTGRGKTGARLERINARPGANHRRHPLLPLQTGDVVGIVTAHSAGPRTETASHPFHTGKCYGTGSGYSRGRP